VRISANTLTRATLAIVSGFAIALAFPKFDLSPLGWVGFVPLFYAFEGESMKRVLGWSYLAGVACYSASLYWVVITLTTFTEVRFVLAMLPMLALAAVVAIYFAIAVWAGEFIARRIRIPIVVTMPIAWAAVEWVRSFFPLGFPWNLLGESAWQNLDLIQFAEFTGTYGVSALIVLFNATVFVVLFRRDNRRVQIASLSAVTLLMVAALAFGSYRVRQVDSVPAAGKFRAAMVQGNIPQTLKWNPDYLNQSFKVYVDETVDASRQGVDVVIWPEAAAEFLFQPDDNYPPQFAAEAQYRDATLKLAKATGDALLFGAPALGSEDGHPGFFNRAYLVSPDGKVAAHYDKMQLVPFGEYVPMRTLFGFFVERIVHGFGDMLPGREQTLFDVKGAKLGILICYESIFPDLTRRAVNGGADVLVNITNDAWYGMSSAPYQLLAMAAMRSVETKVPMIRVANTGISAIILPTGRVTASTPLFKRDTEIEDLSWRPVRTVYTIVGDLFAEICFVFFAAGFVWAWRWPRRLKPLEAHVQEILSRNGKRAAG